MRDGLSHLARSQTMTSVPSLIVISRRVVQAVLLSALLSAFTFVGSSCVNLEDVTHLTKLADSALEKRLSNGCLGCARDQKGVSIWHRATN